MRRFYDFNEKGKAAKVFYAYRFRAELNCAHFLRAFIASKIRSEEAAISECKKNGFRWKPLKILREKLIRRLRLSPERGRIP